MSWGECVCSCVRAHARAQAMEACVRGRWRNGGHFTVCTQFSLSRRREQREGMNENEYIYYDANARPS